MQFLHENPVKIFSKVARSAMYGVCNSNIGFLHLQLMYNVYITILILRTSYNQSEESSSYQIISLVSYYRDNGVFVG